MSINQINTYTLPQINDTLPRVMPEKTYSGSTFSDLMNSAAQKRDLQTGSNIVASVKAAAELLTLEMMKSALSLGGESVATPISPFGNPLPHALTNSADQIQNFDASVNIAPVQDEPSVGKNPTLRFDSAVQDIVGRASQKYGVDGALINAVIKAESNFNASAVSNAGAQGLMQLMPATARGLGVKDSFNPEQNIMAGTRFLKDMMNRYHGNLDSALAAYNWGPGNVDRKGISSLPQETREYLSKVKSYYQQFVG